MVQFIGEKHASNAAGSTSSSLTVGVPSGVSNGDVMLALVFYNVGRTLNPPGAWTQIYSKETNAFGFQAALFYRICSAEPSSYTWHLSGSDDFGVCHLAFGGVKSEAPAHTNFKVNVPGSRNETANGVTVSETSAIITMMASYTASTNEITHTSPDAGTELVDFGNDEGSYAFTGAAYWRTENAGTYAFEIDQAGGAPDGSITFTVALSSGGIPATFTATAPHPVVAGFTASQDALGTLTGTAGVAYGSMAGEVIPNVLRAYAPRLTGDGAATVSIGAGMPATAPAARVSLDGFRDFFGTFAVKAPSMRVDFNVENRISGARVVTVRGEDRTTYVVGQRHESEF